MDLPVLIGRGPTVLRLVAVAGSNGPPAEALVHLTTPGLTAEHRVAAQPGSGFDGLVAYASDLAERWRGWRGPRVWRSLEGDLEITARHDDHVVWEVKLATSRWSVQAAMTLDPGAELTSVAADLARALS